jgi:predicted nucleic-acid-binding protein
MREKNMIYIFTEDSRDGKELIESVVKILYPDYDIKVDTLQGIYNAVNKLKDKIFSFVLKIQSA